MKKITCVLLLLVMLLSMAVPAFANSAEPPGMTILSNDLPQGTVLTLVTPEGEILEFRQIIRSDKAWESQYRLWFPWDFKDWNGTKLCVTVGNDSFTCSMPEVDGMQYNTVVTLDYKDRTLALGQEPWRQPLLTGIRILLTLLCEGLVFLAFGFRKVRSWLVFVIVNLLTQGWLNIAINDFAFSSSYILLALVGMEICIFLTEAVIFPIAVRERKVWQRIVYSITANAVSLAAGVLLISNLPI